MSYITNGECSTCGYIEGKEDIAYNENKEPVFSRCPNCGTTYTLTSSCVWVSRPDSDYSNTGVVRVVIGGIILINGCVWGLVNKWGAICIVTGLILIIWGRILRKNRMESAQMILDRYPYWKRLNESKK